MPNGPAVPDSSPCEDSASTPGVQTPAASGVQSECAPPLAPAGTQAAGQADPGPDPGGAAILTLVSTSSRNRPGQRRHATRQEVVQALDAPTIADRTRLGTLARLFRAGSEYRSARELVHEALQTAFVAAVSRDGAQQQHNQEHKARKPQKRPQKHRPEARAWPVDVPFMVYLGQTMRGMAGDSRKSWWLFRNIGAGRQDDEPDSRHSQDELLAEQREARASGLMAALLTEAPETRPVVEGLQAGMSPAQTMEKRGLSKTQYDSAWRSVRRKLTRLRGGGSPNCTSKPGDYS
jgi:hypothetical protein